MRSRIVHALHQLAPRGVRIAREHLEASRAQAPEVAALARELDQRHRQNHFAASIRAALAVRPTGDSRG